MSKGFESIEAAINCNDELERLNMTAAEESDDESNAPDDDPVHVNRVMHHDGGLGDGGRQRLSRSFLEGISRTTRVHSKI